MVDLAAPFNALIAQNNAPAPNPLAMVGQYAQAQTGLAQADSAQLANAQQHLQFITDGLTPLIAKGANVTPADVASAGAEVVATSKGRVAPSEIASFIGQMPSDGPGIANFLQQHLMRIQDANSRLATLRGQPTETQTGGGTQFGTRNAFTNTYTPQGQNGYVPNQPGVGVTEGPSVMTAGGPQKTVVSNQQLYDLTQGKAHVGPGGTIVYGQSGAQPAPTAASPSASAAPNGQPAPAMARVPVSPAPPLNPDGSIPAQGQLVPVGAPSGAAGAADVASQDSARQGQQLLAAADTVPQTRATIDNMKALLPQFTSGPYAAGINRAKAITNELGQASGVGNVFDPKTVAAQEEFYKQAEMLAQQSFAALGGTGTDKQLASAHGSNPNDLLSGQGNAQILPMLEGLQDAVQAKAAAWQKYRQQNGDASYGAFQDSFNKNFSPRAFQFVRMSPDQRQKLFQSMNKTERAQLGSALQNAEQQGWIKPGG